MYELSHILLYCKLVEEFHQDDLCLIFAYFSCFLAIALNVISMLP